MCQEGGHQAAADVVREWRDPTMQGTYAHYMHTMTQKWSARPGLTILVDACEASLFLSSVPGRNLDGGRGRCSSGTLSTPFPSPIASYIIGVVNTVGGAIHVHENASCNRPDVSLWVCVDDRLRSHTTRCRYGSVRQRCILRAGRYRFDRRSSTGWSGISARGHGREGPKFSNAGAVRWMSSPQSQGPRKLPIDRQPARLRGRHSRYQHMHPGEPENYRRHTGRGLSTRLHDPTGVRYTLVRTHLGLHAIGLTWLLDPCRIANAPPGSKLPEGRRTLRCLTRRPSVDVPPHAICQRLATTLAADCCI